ncbi:hypothetical protein MMC09_002677 [Bachmanniomyces sp. S44760]|nr:hypothetical protein [Bachmanniomyces sp. S44760]
MVANADTIILVTGGSGFVSLHCIAQCLTAGYKVRTTVRSESKKQSVLKGLEHSDPVVDASKVEFVIADLLKDEGWAEAVIGVSLVLHLASPFPGAQPKDENEVIRPAVEGTLRVLKASKASGTVKRIVLTSSVAAVTYGVGFENGKIFDESHWSDPEGKNGFNTPYTKSKTLAEKAAWDFMEREGGSLELSVVNPAAIYGPALLLPNESTTCDVIKQMLQGKLPLVPDVSFGIVDVRDVAALHLLAATKPEAKGQRYLCVAGETISLAQVGGLLKSGLGAKASKVPTKVLPNMVTKMLSYLMPQMGQVVGELGRTKKYSNAKAKSVGWSPRSNEEAVVSCGQALLDAGVV